jgi:hypothetical protein
LVSGFRVLLIQAQTDFANTKTPRTKTLSRLHEHATNKH